MKNLFYELPSEIINNIYKYDDNMINKSLYNKVIEDLNKKRIIQFIKYNVIDDNKYVYSFESKISRMYIMDLLGDDDFLKYTDYQEILDSYGSSKELMRRNSSKYEIAKNYKKNKELYNVIINEYINNDDDDMVYDILKDFEKWIIEHGYYDKRILKNEIFENWENKPIQTKAKQNKKIVIYGAMKAMIMIMKQKKMMKNKMKSLFFLNEMKNIKISM